ncbi:acclimation of photosynthesis to environment [Striga asiatica]|uniref:Acclimation of photosynthesis to environment n=1 Tax=Striga asiatica TaxID=4170 RepID=A0A5A7QSZ9_STRAF|nr:acclimation of photosynthesis to environment [Striga asiatica]
MKSAVAEMAGGRIVPLSPPLISSGYTCCLLPLRRLSLASSGMSGPSLCSAFSASNRALFLSETLVECQVPRPRLVRAAAESTQSSSVSPTTSADKLIVADNEFSLAKVSFGVIGLGVGVTLLSYGFGAYFNILPGSEWSAIMLTYGFPLAIIGMALKYAELKPVPCLTYSDAEALREKCATPILKQVRNDVTRYRYGDEQHLDEALKRIFQYGQGGGIPRRSAPILQMIREEMTEDGRYSLILVFEAKALQLSDFEQRKTLEPLLCRKLNLK